TVGAGGARKSIRTWIALRPDTQRKALLQDLVARGLSREPGDRKCLPPLPERERRAAWAFRDVFRLVGRGGLEPPTSAIASAKRSAHHRDRAHSSLMARCGWN